MLYQDNHIQDALRVITQHLTADFHLREDLYQEGILWLMETEPSAPGHEKSYYLQGCKHFLIDKIRSGRSVDAPKRQHLCEPHPDLSESVASTPEGLIANNRVRPAVYAADLLAQLSARLRPVERWVLEALVKGHGEGEIAEALQVTRQAVAKYRKKIAATYILLAE